MSDNNRSNFRVRWRDSEKLYYALVAWAEAHGFNVQQMIGGC